MDLFLNWQEGVVGNHFLSVGLEKDVFHLYQTLWTGETWWAESKAFNIDKVAFESLSLAKLWAENETNKWFAKALYNPDDGIWSFTDNL